MSEPSDSMAILKQAAERGQQIGLPYGGAVKPDEAWTLFQAQGGTIIDVRSEAEYRFVGHVPGTPNLPWRGQDAENVQDFVRRLQEVAPPGTPLLFLCRSAARSHHAAAAAANAGYPHSYNILEGFEGQKNAQEQRGQIDGWRKRGLPWVQD